MGGTQPEVKHAGLHLGQFSFTPNIFLTLLAISFFILFIWLGFWQVERGQQAQQLQAEYKAMQTIAPISLDDMYGAAINYRFRLLKVSGHFDNSHAILLDNKILQNKPGYQVIMPFYVKGKNKAILINRGWIPMGKSRSEKVNLKPVLGDATLEGFIYIPQNEQFVLGTNVEKPASNEWPIKIHHIDVPALSKLLKTKLYSFVLYLSPKSQHGFAREWKPVTRSPAKHHGYAFQWFAMAGAIFILYFVLTIRKRKNR